MLVVVKGFIRGCVVGLASIGPVASMGAGSGSPLGSVDNLFQNVLQGFIRRLCESIHLWVVRGSLFVHYGVMVGEPLNNRVEKVAK